MVNKNFFPSFPSKQFKLAAANPPRFWGLNIFMWKKYFQLLRDPIALLWENKKCPKPLPRM